MLRLTDYGDEIEIYEKMNSIDIYINEEKCNIRKGKKLEELIKFLEECNKWKIIIIVFTWI